MDSTAFTESNRATSIKSRITFGKISLFEWNFIILGGLVFLLPAMMFLGEDTLAGKNPIEWYFWINAMLSAPHVFVTYVRLNRKIEERSIHWFWGLPLYIATVFLVAIGLITKSYLQIMTFVNVWQSYHYARQVYGVGRVYSKENVESNLAKTLCYWAYHLALPLFVLGRWNMLFIAWKGKPSDVIIPFHVPDPFMALFFVLGGIGLIVGLCSEFLKFKSNDRYNPVGLVNLLVYYFIHWIGFLSIDFYQRGFFSVTCFHALQYIALLWWFERYTALNKKPKSVELRYETSAISKDASEIAREDAEVREEVFHASTNSNTNSTTSTASNTATVNHEMSIGDRLKKLFLSGPVMTSFTVFWAVSFGLSFYLSNDAINYLSTFWLYLGTALLGAQSAHHYAVDTVLWRAKAGR